MYAFSIALLRCLYKSKRMILKIKRNATYVPFYIIYPLFQSVSAGRHNFRFVDIWLFSAFFNFDGQVIGNRRFKDRDL